MDKGRVHFFRCPYCSKYMRDGGHGHKTGKNEGLYYVKQLYESILILECQKCKKVCRLQFVGSPLTWEDMSSAERKAFQRPHFEAYQESIKSKEDKNERKPSKRVPNGR